MVSPVAEFSPSRWLKFMSVEPAMFLSMVACTMLDFGNVNIYLQKACRTNTTAEPDLSTSCDDKEKGVIFVANVNTYIRSATMFLVLLSVALYASWSDRAGRKRKFFLMITLVGLVLESILLFLHSYYWSLPPMFAAITAAVVHVLFGHPHSSMSAFGFMYLCDVVDLQSRTMRLGIFTSVKVLGMLVGKGASGFLLHYIGFCRYYAVCLGISLVAVIFGYFFIKDISIPQEKKVSLRSVFNVCHLIESFKIIFGNRNTKHRICTIILILTFTLLLFIHEGQNGVTYLYLKHKFDWNEKMYSLFLVYGSIGMILGTSVSSIILSKLLNIHDSVIGIISTLWDSAVALSYIFASENWQLYLTSGMDIFFGVSLTVCSSLLSKFYDTTELGHLFAVKMLFGLLMAFCHPVYSILLKTTLHTIPYAFFLVSFGLYLISTISFGIIRLMTKK